MAVSSPVVKGPINISFRDGVNEKRTAWVVAILTNESDVRHNQTDVEREGGRELERETIAAISQVLWVMAVANIFFSFNATCDDCEKSAIFNPITFQTNN